MPSISKFAKAVAKPSNNLPLSPLNTLIKRVKGKRRRQRGNKNEEIVDEDYVTENNEEDNYLDSIEIENEPTPEDQKTDIPEETGLVGDSEYVSVINECQDSNINIPETTLGTSEGSNYNDLKLKTNSSYNALLIETEKFKAKLLDLFFVSFEKELNDVDFKLYDSNNSEVNILSYVDNIIKMLKTYDNSNNTCLNYELKFTNESIIQLNQYLNRLKFFENVTDSNIRLSTNLGLQNILDINKKNETRQLFQDIVRNHTSQLKETLMPLNLEYIKQNELQLGNKQGVGLEQNSTSNGISVDDKIVVNNNSSSFTSNVDKPLEPWKDYGTSPKNNLMSNGSFLNNEVNTNLTTQTSIIKLPDEMDYNNSSNSNNHNSSLNNNNTTMSPSNDIFEQKNDTTFILTIVVIIISIVVAIGLLIVCISCCLFKKAKRRIGLKELKRIRKEAKPFIKTIP